MDPTLFIAVSVLVPTIIAMLALRFGVDSRPTYRSQEHTLALGGMRWTDDPPPVGNYKPRLRIVRDTESSAYPTLVMIDRIRGPEAASFACDPQAARLEDRARQLTDEYWSDTVWLTGLVPAAAFWVVCEALEQERLTESQSMALPLAG